MCGAALIRFELLAPLFNKDQAGPAVFAANSRCRQVAASPLLARSPRHWGPSRQPRPPGPKVSVATIRRPHYLTVRPNGADHHAAKWCRQIVEALDVAVRKTDFAQQQIQSLPGIQSARKQKPLFQSRD
jgi:hypothetical protein